MSVEIMLICEGSTEQKMIPALVDRLLVESVDYIRDQVCVETEWDRPENLDHFRQWYRHESNSHIGLYWRETKALAEEFRIPVFGRYSAENRKKLDEQMARRALAVIQRLAKTRNRPFDWVILSRDTDNKLERRAGIKNACAEAKLDSCTIILAVAHTKAECWLLAALEPVGDDEISRHERERKRLGYDPLECSERLEAEGNKGKHNAKSVLEAILGGDADADADVAWTRLESALRGHRPMGADTTALEKRSQGNGLKDFLDDMRGAIGNAFGTGSGSG